jgi:hypothetical protein
MRADLIVGSRFPDYRLPDHNGQPRTLSEIQGDDTAVQDLEATLVARAFGSLPGRWQTVLWHIEVEGDSPARVAELLGLTANGVSALAYRAREGLRRAYLQVHLQDIAREECRYAVERLGSWTRLGLSKRAKTRVDAHLGSCGRCQALATELTDVNGGLRAALAPLVVGWPSVAGYLSAVTTGKATAAAALGVARTAGAAGNAEVDAAAGGAVAGPTAGAAAGSGAGATAAAGGAGSAAGAGTAAFGAAGATAVAAVGGAGSPWLWSWWWPGRRSLLPAAGWREAERRPRRARWPPRLPGAVRGVRPP